VKSLSFSKKEALKFVVVIVLVSLLALTIYSRVPQVQENRLGSGSNGNSGLSASQYATYWWSMLQTMNSNKGAGASYFTPTAPSTSQTVPETNQTLWTAAIGSVSSSPAVGDGDVFAVGDNGVLYAVNASTGSIVWCDPSGYVGSPAFADGKVFVGSSDNTTCALDASTGVLLWSYPTGNVATSGPTVADGVVYVGSGDGTYSSPNTAGGVVYALNATTGALIWSYTTGSPLVSSAAVAGGEVFIGSADHGIYALNASIGVVIWTCNILLFHSSPAVAGGVVYVGSWDTNVYALNATTGTVIWKQEAGFGVYSSPGVAGGIVYVGSLDRNVYALNATTGTIEWNYTTDDVVLSSPAVAGGIVYIQGGSFDHNFYALNATNGALIWSYRTGGGTSSPAVYDDVVFAGSDAGIFYAFGQYPFSVSISPFSVEMNVGQSQVFSSRVMGGTSPYTFQWYLDDAPVSGATDASWTFTPTSAGSYTVYLEVTDDLGTLAISTSASASVTVPPIISILNPGPESYPSGWNASSNVRYIGTPDFVFYSNETSLGSTFFVNITVTNVTDLYAWGIGLLYDNTTLQFVNAWLPTDNVLNGATASGGTLIEAPAVVDTVPLNSTYAILKWGCTFIQGSENWCFNGTGTLGQIEFKIIGAANSTPPQMTSTFTFDPDWTTIIYWPITYSLTYDVRAPLLGAGSFAYIS
jgi:outer membrane protein assembly factor BamB